MRAADLEAWGRACSAALAAAGARVEGGVFSAENADWLLSMGDVDLEVEDTPAMVEALEPLLRNQRAALQALVAPTPAT